MTRIYRVWRPNWLHDTWQVWGFHRMIAECRKKEDAYLIRDLLEAAPR